MDRDLFRGRELHFLIGLAIDAVSHVGQWLYRLAARCPVCVLCEKAFWIERCRAAVACAGKMCRSMAEVVENGGDN